MSELVEPSLWLEGRSLEDFYGSETILYNSRCMYYICQKTIDIQHQEWKTLM